MWFHLNLCVSFYNMFTPFVGPFAFYGKIRGTTIKIVWAFSRLKFPLGYNTTFHIDIGPYNSFHDLIFICLYDYIKTSWVETKDLYSATICCLKLLRKTIFSQDNLVLGHSLTLFLLGFISNLNILEALVCVLMPWFRNGLAAKMLAL